MRADSIVEPTSRTAADYLPLSRYSSIPTDCPQRDERLGWTGDLNVFAETATFLYDVGGLLRSWLVDLAADQADEYGVVPVIVPNILQPYGPQKPIAIWGDVCVSLPYDLRQAYGDDDMVVQQWNSMKSWLDDGIKYDDQGLWSPAANQLGDWLDPAAPPERAGDSVTDPHFVANAWLVHSLDMMQKLAGIVGDSTDRDQYARRYSQALKAFTKEYQITNGRLCADTQTGIALGLRFGLVEGPAKAKTIHRPDYLCPTQGLHRQHWLCRNGELDGYVYYERHETTDAGRRLLPADHPRCPR